MDEQKEAGEFTGLFFYFEYYLRLFMKNILITSTLILTFVYAKAQVQQQYLQDPTQYGKTLEANTGIEVQGNPYFTEGWHAGLASLTQEGAQFKFSKMRYNVLKEHVEFDNAGKILFLDPIMFSQFILIKGTDSLVFRNKMEGIKNIDAKAYAQIIFDGMHTWILKPTKSLTNDPEATYGSIKKKIIQSDENFFVIKSNKEVITFKMTSRSVSKSLGIESKTLTEFLDKSGYSLENSSHYKSIFTWLDTQI